MRIRTTARQLLLGLTALVGAASAGAQVKAIGPLKAFKGPEGQVVSMVEVNDAAHMLVHFRSLGGELEGKSRIYLLDSRSADRKDVYFEKKQGSKTVRFVVLTQLAGGWLFTHPSKPGTEFRLRYSEADSRLEKIEDLVAAISE